MAHRVPAPKRMTVDEFLVYPAPDGKAELVRGEVRLNPPTGARHGAIVANVLAELLAFVRPRELGLVFADSGYELLELPRTVRAPDVSFVGQERIPPEGVGARFLRLAPDLAVEVLSPSEAGGRLEEKLEDYRAADVPMVWIIDPPRRRVTVLVGDHSTTLGERDALDGGLVLPGLTLPVARLFLGI